LATDPKTRSDQEWRETLTQIEYYVLRQAGTERPFTGQYWDSAEPGTYHCAGCDASLFRSTDKYSSGCGWPSFTRALEAGTVIEREDRSHNMLRVEVLCRACEGHLGHVFTDGPPPEGRRFCINSVSIRLVPGDGGAV
jgi:peptide-methionine (R)-S-oxide reductase